jgi:triosephosphate isomerase
MGKLLIANWKSNPETTVEAGKLARTIARETRSAARNVEIVLCPPFIFLELVSKTLNPKPYTLNPKLGAQDAFWSSGPYTGEVSIRQLKKIGVKYVIVGHSERRRYLNESDEIINRKLRAVLDAGMNAILCVGEPKLESGVKNYELRIKRAKAYVRKQLEKDLRGIHNSQFKLHNSLIIAYEPVWAIGTGLADSPEHAAEMAKFIKSFLTSKPYMLSPKILYGGSVTAKNAGEFLSFPEIAGALVGGASLNIREFKKIIGLAAMEY